MNAIPVKIVTSGPSLLRALPVFVINNADIVSRLTALETSLQSLTQLVQTQGQVINLLDIASNALENTVDALQSSLDGLSSVYVPLNTTLKFELPSASVISGVNYLHAVNAGDGSTEIESIFIAEVDSYVPAAQAQVFKQLEIPVSVTSSETICKINLE